SGVKLPPRWNYLGLLRSRPTKGRGDAATRETRPGKNERRLAASRLPAPNNGLGAGAEPPPTRPADLPACHFRRRIRPPGLPARLCRSFSRSLVSALQHLENGCKTRSATE